MEKSENRPRMYQVCPACGIIEPSDEHLMDEYLSLNKARFNDVFDAQTKYIQAKVASMLHARGITEIPNIFGPIQVR
ncbi:MAG: hypothetical protein BWY95_00960 [Bacteroidetes bacterium ADurb.BinA104]|nr:MAG: hypothetical protein BWY95_00960 [Bacteroidetes bacterium ADurb.BinA104]